VALGFGLLALGGWALQEQGDADKQDAKTDAAPKAEVGKDAPDFELTGCDDKKCKLSDYKEKTVVLEWLSQDCPVSNYGPTGAGPTMKKLAAAYKEKGIVWLGIDSTHYQTAAKDKQYIEENEIPYPILMDADGKVGRVYGAKTTPHIFIVQKGKLVYAGAHRSKDGERDYISESLDALLAGQEVPVAQTRSYGCSIKYKKK